MLQHFKEALQRVEEGPPMKTALRRLEAAPRSGEELGEMPLLLSATWAPDWKEVLGTARVHDGLAKLLGSLVEVETFCLHYSRMTEVNHSADRPCRSLDKRDSVARDASDAGSCCDRLPSRVEHRAFEGVRDNIGHSAITSEAESRPGVFRENGERKVNLDGCIPSMEGTIRGGSDKSGRNPASPAGLGMQILSGHDCEEFKDMPREECRGSCASNPPSCESASPLTFWPIPSSRTEVMPLAECLKEASRLSELSGEDLLYLTWRGLPLLESMDASLPPQFQFFVRELLAPTLRAPFLPSSAMARQHNLWAGSLATSRLHFDALDNLHVCCHGSKVVHLYPPGHARHVYPQPWQKEALNNWSSLPSILCADRTKHRLFFENASGFRAEVHAGEAIYIPAGWWHEVFTLEFSLSVNSWFPPSSSACLRPTLMMLRSERYHKFVSGRGAEVEEDNEDCDDGTLLAKKRRTS